MADDARRSTRDPAATPARTKELRALVRLALPIVAVNLGNLLTGIVDTAVVGRLGEVQLGAVGLGNAIFFLISVIGMGVMLGLDPLASQALGANEPRRARHLLWQGSWLACVIAVPLTFVVLTVTAQLQFIGIEPANAEHAARYIHWRLPSLIPFLLVAASRSYLQAHDITRPLLIGVVVANVINAPVSWLLVFGDEGLAAFDLAPIGLGAGMGTSGAGLASTIAACVQLAVLLVAVRALPMPRAGSGAASDLTHDDDAIRRPDAAEMWRVFSLGLPIGLMFFLEVGLFSGASILMGVLGRLELAAHQVAISLASAAFMVPLGIGAAAAVRVGRAVGRGDVEGTRQAGFMALALGVLTSGVTAAAFWLWPQTLSRLITDQGDVIELATVLLTIAAVFQLVDGMQAIAAGALRGAGDTRWPLFVNLVGHYAVGLPVGVGLAFFTDAGAAGLWWGMLAGLSVVAVALTLRFAVLTREPIARQ